MARTIVEINYSNFEETQNKIFDVLQVNGYKNVNKNNEIVWECGKDFLTAMKYIKIDFISDNTLLISGWVETSPGNEEDLEEFVGCVPKQQNMSVISQIQSCCNRYRVVVCGYCNYKNSADSKFCMGCGKELNVKVYGSTEYSFQKCTNCGADIKYGEDFCGVCGARASQFVNYSNNSQYNDYVTDDKLIDGYIGKYASKLKDGAFSVYSLVFGIYYLMYRKMWFLAAIGIIILLVSNIFLSPIAPGINLCFNIVVAIQFKQWYLANVKKNVEKIKSQNVGASQQELIEKCKRKGGTSMLALILTIILCIILPTLVAFRIIREKQRAYDRVFETIEMNSRNNRNELEIY